MCVCLYEGKLEREREGARERERENKEVECGGGVSRGGERDRNRVCMLAHVCVFVRARACVRVCVYACMRACVRASNS